MLLWQRHWHIAQMLQMFIHLSSVAGSWPNLVFFGHCSTWVWQSTTYPWNTFFLLLYGVVTTECCQETHELSLVSVVHRIYKTFVHQTEEMWAAPPPAPGTTVWSRGTWDTAQSFWASQQGHHPTSEVTDLARARKWGTMDWWGKVQWLFHFCMSQHPNQNLSWGIRRRVS